MSGVSPMARMKRKRLGDVLGDFLVTVPGGAVLDEAEIPPMHMLEIGVAALREGAQQIERGGGLPIGHQHALRIGMRAASVNSMPLMMSPR